MPTLSYHTHPLLVPIFIFISYTPTFPFRSKLTSLPPYNPFTSPHFNLPKTGLPLAASTTHPPIKHSPPNGVTGPKNLNRCGSNTSK
jgi:hypothetical protein